MYEHLLNLRQLPLLALDISCHISEIPLHDLVCCTHASLFTQIVKANGQSYRRTSHYRKEDHYNNSKPKCDRADAKSSMSVLGCTITIHSINPLSIV